MPTFSLFWHSKWDERLKNTGFVGTPPSERLQKGLNVRGQVPIKVRYAGQIIGEYFADLLVEDKVIVELKAVEKIIPVHEAQLLNYLKATDLEVGLLLNFGPKADFTRKIFTNHRK